MTLLATACSNCRLKGKFMYAINFILLLLFVTATGCFIIFNFYVCSRQLLLRYRIFWFLVESKKLYSVHKKVNCGDLHLSLHHNLVIRFVFCFMLSPGTYSDFHVWGRFQLKLQYISLPFLLGGGFGSLQFYIDTVKQMAVRQLVAGSPLRTLCLLIAGQPAEVFSTGTGIDSLNVSQQHTQVIYWCMKFSCKGYLSVRRNAYSEGYFMKTTDMIWSVLWSNWLNGSHFILMMLLLCITFSRVIIWYFWQRNTLFLENLSFIQLLLPL